MRRSVTWTTMGLLGLLIILVAGCSRRNDPVASTVSGESGAVIKFTHDFLTPGYLRPNGEGLTLTESPIRTSKTYIPPYYMPPGQGRPYPVLYLLLDFGGNGQTDDVTDDYYFEIDLHHIADSLILGGVIKPMMIATVDLYNAYGGSWYASNDVQGRYGDCLLEFVRYTDTAMAFSQQNGRRSRGISGVGMGGYGAILLSMRNPSYFAAASSVGGYLAFTTASVTHDYDGLNEWIPFVFQENFVTPLPPGQQPTQTSLLPYYSMSPNINRPFLKPYTNLMLSMAAAFSPMTYMPQVSSAGDTTWLPAGTAADSLTWMNRAVAGGIERDWKVTLPFDWSGLLWPYAWEKWRVMDVAQILSENPVALSGVETLIMVGTSSEYNVLQQNRIYRDVAQASGVSNMTYMEYDSYGDYPTDRRRYLDRVLRTILEFHSEQFVDDFTLGP